MPRRCEVNLLSPQPHLTPLKPLPIVSSEKPHLLAILLPMQSTFHPLRVSTCPTSQPALRALRTKRERQKRMLTSFIDEDCQESRLQMKGLNLAGEEEMPEVAGACAPAGCQRWQAAQLFSSSDYIFFACLVGRMEQCLQLSSSPLDRNLSFHPLPVSSFITELWGLGVLFVLVVYSHRKPLKSLLKRRALGVTDKETCQSKQDPAQPGRPPMGACGSQGSGRIHPGFLLLPVG